MLLCDSIHSIRSLWHTLLSFICRLEYIEIHIAANKTKFEANVNCEAHIYKFRYHQTHKGFQLAELQFAWLVGLHAFDLSFGSFAFRWKTHREWWSIWTFSILLPLIKSINIVLRDWCEIKSACALSFFFFGFILASVCCSFYFILLCPHIVFFLSSLSPVGQFICLHRYANISASIRILSQQFCSAALPLLLLLSLVLPSSIICMRCVCLFFGWMSV